MPGSGIADGVQVVRVAQPFPIVEPGANGLLQVVDNGRFPFQLPIHTSRIPMEPDRRVAGFTSPFIPIGRLLKIVGHETEIALDAKMNDIRKKEGESGCFGNELEAKFAGRGAGRRVVGPAVPADLVDAL